MERERIRVFFSKTGDLRFLSHLDLIRTWERALRRTGLDLEFTQGFNPRLRLSFSSALPTGVESQAEFVETTLVPSEGSRGAFEAEETISTSELQARIGAQLPAGLDLLRIDRRATKGNRPRPSVLTWEASRARFWPPDAEDLQARLMRLDPGRRARIQQCEIVQGHAGTAAAEAGCRRLRLSLALGADGSHLNLAELLTELIEPSPLDHPLRLVKLASEPETRGETHEIQRDGTNDEYEQG